MNAPRARTAAAIALEIIKPVIAPFALQNLKIKTCRDVSRELFLTNVMEKVFIGLIYLCRSH